MTSSTGILPPDFRFYSLSGVLVSFSAFFVLFSIYQIANAIYNVYFSPLKHIPGPFLARASGLPYSIKLRTGTIVPWVRQLHEQYGDAVRVSPREVSFISGETAWTDIYGFRTGKNKTETFLKDKSWYPIPVNGIPSLINADDETHSRYRRNLSHAFSDKVLREQENIIQGFVDLLVHRLHEKAQEGNDVNIMRWYNYTTFDIIADLTFGEPLYCLRDQDYHPWVDMVFASAKAVGFLLTKKRSSAVAFYDRVRNFFSTSGGADVTQKRVKFFGLASEKVTARLNRETDRPDFFKYIEKGQGNKAKAMAKPEMDSSAVLFLIAGSETTATLLTGVTYLLLKNPETYNKVLHEVRSKFKTASEITIEEVNKLEYMIAALQEGLRYYPPVPTGFPRVVPRGGGTVSGMWIPEGTSVYVSQHAANRSTRNFASPDSYIPERWLGDERFQGDNKAVVNAFSFGPRNCLGKNLAYAEMRLIVAKVLFSFDLELADPHEDWMAKNKVFTLWEKPPLMVKLHPVQR